MKNKRIKKANKKIKRLFLFNTATTLTFLIIASQAFANYDIYETPYLIFEDIYDYDFLNVGVNNHRINFNETIRIGLESRYLNASAISFGNTTLSISVASYNHTPLTTISGQNFRVIVDNGYYLDSGFIFGTFEEASVFADYITNDNTVISALYSGFGVLVGPFNNAYNMSRANSNGFSHVYASTRRVTLTDGYERVLTSNRPLRFTDPMGFMNVRYRYYRGIIEAGRHTGSGITPVNIVNIEEYLKSVVPSEMPANWHMEALKAQTIAARSFTFVRRGSHNHLGYELCDTVFSQVYSGINMEHERSTHAVLATAGLLAWHGNEIILATYFSSSGGATENSEYVWQQAVPYLRGVSDRFEIGAREWERSFTMTDINRFATNAGIRIGNINSVSLYHAPNGRVRRLTLHGSNGTHFIEREAIRTFFNISEYGSLPSRNFVMIGGNYAGTTTVRNQVYNQPVSRGLAFLSGTNNRASIVPTHFYTLDEQGNSVRQTQYLTIIGLDNIPDFEDYIPNIPVVPAPYVPDPTITSIVITRSNGYSLNFVGRGWGHGVGMSQFGANSMAQLGFDHVAILQHYFSGVEIR